jgi:hypothetical protein
MTFRRSLSAILVCLTAGLVGLLETVRTQAGTIETTGLRHEIYVAVNKGRFERALAPKPEGSKEATITVVLYFADHAREANFSGGVAATFSNLDTRDGSDQRKVWDGDTCHQNRGVPKIRITALYGSLKSNGGSTSIFAEPRHLGRRLPADEIVETGALADGNDPIGHFKLLVAESRQSGFAIMTRLYDFPCKLIAPLAK